LAYADSLIETEMPENVALAEYIQLSFELATNPSFRMQENMVKRLNQLHSEFEQEWAKRFPTKPYNFSYGFVEQVRISLQGWLDKGHEWVRTAPIKSINFVNIAPLRIMYSKRVIIYGLWPAISPLAGILKKLAPKYKEEHPFRVSFHDDGVAYQLLAEACINWARETHPMNLAERKCTWCGKYDTEIKMGQSPCMEPID